MVVRIPTPLHEYTRNQSAVDAQGGTVDEVTRDLDRQFPGIRFRMIDEQDRIRMHMKIFVNGEQVFDLGTPVAERDEVFIIQAFSGG
jgi:molybdopterin converting factor small subunit